MRKARFVVVEFDEGILAESKAVGNGLSEFLIEVFDGLGVEMVSDEVLTDDIGTGFEIRSLKVGVFFDKLKIIFDALHAFGECLVISIAFE